MFIKVRSVSLKEFTHYIFVFFLLYCHFSHPPGGSLVSRLCLFCAPRPLGELGMGKIRQKPRGEGAGREAEREGAESGKSDRPPPSHTHPWPKHLQGKSNLMMLPAERRFLPNENFIPLVLTTVVENIEDSFYVRIFLFLFNARIFHVFIFSSLFFPNQN